MLPDPARRLRLGIAGIGRVVERYYLPALEDCPEWDLVAACDVRADRRRWLQERRPALSISTELDALRSIPGLDAIIIATPPETHHDLTIASLAAGLHVLVEKPVALTAKEARRMTAVAEQNGRRLQVGFNRRFYRAFGTLKKRLASIRPAELQKIICNMCFNTETWDAVSGYLGDDARGGGVVHDVAVHQMDLLKWLTGFPIEAVLVTEERGGATAHRIEYQLQFSSGFVAECIASHGHRYDESLEVVLSAGRLIVQNGRLYKAGYATWAGMNGRRLLAFLTAAARLGRGPHDPTKSFTLQLRSFAEMIRGHGASAATDAREGAESALAVEACQRARAQLGCWIPLERL